MGISSLNSLFWYRTYRVTKIAGRTNTIWWCHEMGAIKYEITSQNDICMSNVERFLEIKLISSEIARKRPITTYGMKAATCSGSDTNAEKRLLLPYRRRAKNP